jgi:hypothetical protein
VRVVFKLELVRRCLKRGQVMSISCRHNKQHAEYSRAQLQLALS